MYEITEYTKKRAKELGVVVKPSRKKGKKIDVIKNGEVIASVGGKGYSDYPTYMKNDGKKVADERRRLYYQRHKKDINKGNGYWASHLLW
jgi:hypothetical protein